MKFVTRCVCCKDSLGPWNMLVWPLSGHSEPSCRRTPGGRSYAAVYISLVNQSVMVDVCSRRTCLNDGVWSRWMLIDSLFCVCHWPCMAELLANKSCNGASHETSITSLTTLGQNDESSKSYGNEEPHMQAIAGVLSAMGAPRTSWCMPKPTQQGSLQIHRNTAFYKYKYIYADSPLTTQTRINCCPL